jgi:hypothetical protein
MSSPLLQLIFAAYSQREGRAQSQSLLQERGPECFRGRSRFISSAALPGSELIMCVGASFAMRAIPFSFCGLVFVFVTSIVVGANSLLVVVLSLTNLQITDTGLVHLRGLTNLASLDLTGTKVSDAGLENLMGLIGLRALQLEDTRVTMIGLKKLGHALPSLFMSHSIPGPALILDKPANPGRFAL